MQRRFFSLVVGLTVALVCVTGSFAALAAGTSIKDARNEIADMRSKLSDAITQLTNLDSHLIDLHTAMENAATDIDALQSESAKAFIDDAITIKDEVIPINLEMLIGADGILLDFEEEKQSLKGIVLALINNKKIKAVNGNRILRNLNTINLLVQGVINELDEVSALIEDGDEGEDIPSQIGCDEDLTDLPNDEEDCDDINDWLGAAIEHIDNGDFDDAADAIEQAINLCEQAAQIVDRILLKKISYILKSLDAADNVLKVEQYKKLAGRPYREGFGLISKDTNNQEQISVKIFDVRGQLIFAGTLAEGALGFNTLAAGVYLYLIENQDGTQRIEKRVIQH